MRLLAHLNSESRSVMSNSLWPLWPSRLPCSWNSPGKNTRVGFHSLLQGIFSTQGSNPSLLHCRQLLYHLSRQGSPEGSHYLLHVPTSPSLPPTPHSLQFIHTCSPLRALESLSWQGSWSLSSLETPDTQLPSLKELQRGSLYWPITWHGGNT